MGAHFTAALDMCLSPARVSPPSHARTSSHPMCKFCALDCAAAAQICSAQASLYGTPEVEPALCRRIAAVAERTTLLLTVVTNVTQVTCGNSSYVCANGPPNDMWALQVLMFRSQHYTPQIPR